MEQSKKSTGKTVVIVLLALLTVAAVSVAYYQYDERQQYVTQTTEEREMSQQQMMQAYEKIESNLAQIREHEGLIQNTINAKNKEGNMNPEERIQNEIKIIERIMQENREIIASLNEEVSSKDSKLQDFEKQQRNLNARVNEYKTIVGDLTAQNEALQKDLETIELAKTHLETEIKDLDSQITEKLAELEQLEMELENKENQLHTAYFTVGTFKDLEEKQVVDKEGGILGIAAVKTINEDFDQAQFTQVDMREISEIPVQGKKVEILSNQDPDTYSLKYNGDIVEKIVIENPTAFWEKSKYLVVVVKDKYESDLAEAR